MIQLKIIMFQNGHDNNNKNTKIISINNNNNKCECVYIHTTMAMMIWLFTYVISQFKGKNTAALSDVFIWFITKQKFQTLLWLFITNYLRKIVEILPI